MVSSPIPIVCARELARPRYRGEEKLACHTPQGHSLSGVVAGAGTSQMSRNEMLTPATASDKQDTLLAKETGHFSLIKAMHLADLITEMNGFCGVMSVFSSMRYMAANDPTATGNILAALAFIPLGFFFDGMDGAVARKRKTSSLMGQELDSLADLVRSDPPSVDAQKP